MKNYVKLLLDLISIYLIGIMHNNGKIPKDLKNYAYQFVKPAATTDADRAKPDVKPTAISNMILFKLILEKEFTGSIGDIYLMNYQDLGQELKGDLGVSCLSSINYLELAKNIMGILNEMIKPSVQYFSLIC